MSDTGQIRMITNKERLKAVLTRQGFKNYEEVAKAASEKGIELGLTSIYQIARTGNWQRETLEALCAVLDCDPRDFLDFTRQITLPA